ncbi:hypothetical protein [Pseudarthrobacter phenanthrenivorans]|uniref:hypothetical protein n=1 Tax=Pseudarthrobacter phenanthrenivorans TaxID=361575 RepID=UPI002F360ED1
MTCAKCWIIFLYGLSAVLPLVGFGLSFGKHRRRIRIEKNRAAHIAWLDERRDGLRQAANNEEERNKAEEWYAGENAKKDPSGKPYNIRGGVLFADDSIPRLNEDYKQLQADMTFVGAAVICGAAASIWSMLLPPGA